MIIQQECVIFVENYAFCLIASVLKKLVLWPKEQKKIEKYPKSQRNQGKMGAESRMCWKMDKEDQNGLKISKTVWLRPGADRRRESTFPVLI